MKTKVQFLKSLSIVGSVLVVAALLLVGCDGSLTFQGSVKPNEEGGVDVTGGVVPDTEAQPETAPQPAGSSGLDQTTIILIGVAVAFFILILVMLVTRGQSRNQPPQ